MELEELEQRLGPFAQAMYGNGAVRLSNVHKMPGHAGFSYGFSVHDGEAEDAWYLRLPPPNVKLKGTADVMRQVAVLSALDGGPVPHCTVKWSGEDTKWFGRPYFVVPQLEGDVLRAMGDDWCTGLGEDTRRNMARQVMTALANIHKLNWEEKTPGLGPAIPFDKDVTRWDTFYERAADPEKLARVPEVREKLLSRVPSNAPVGVFHGDFQWSNLFFSFEGELLAVIDWELVGIGATLNDLGWFATFNDPEAWAHEGAVNTLMPPAEELVEMYAEAYGEAVEGLEWFRALAAYKFAIITGFNLSLHRRGKRTDPVWEVTALSMESLIDRALALLE